MAKFKHTRTITIGGIYADISGDEGEIKPAYFRLLGLHAPQILKFKLLGGDATGYPVAIDGTLLFSFRGWLGDDDNTFKCINHWYIPTLEILESLKASEV